MTDRDHLLQPLQREEDQQRPVPEVRMPRIQGWKEMKYISICSGDPCHPLAARAHVPAVAFKESPVAHPAMQVRRLTPKECEYLQGFPADHTNVTFRKKPAADGPRYRALGNSMAVPCMVWLGHRIHKATMGDIS